MSRSFLLGAALCALALAIPLAARAASVEFVGRPAPAQSVNFSLHFPLRNQAQLDALIRLQSDPHSPQFHHFLTAAQFRTAYGAAPQTVARAIAALHASGLTVTKQSAQSLRVSGSAAAVERTFRTTLGIVRDRSGKASIAGAAPVRLPAELAVLGATVTGFESRPHLFVNARLTPTNRTSPSGGYYFDDLKQAYSYPSDQVLDGTGVAVGVMMSADVLDSDTRAAFWHERYTQISGKTPPPLERRVVDGGAPFRGVDDAASDEASVDVQTAQGSAPGAQVVLYNIPSLFDDAVIAGYTDVVEDDAVDVLSSSFGGCELLYTAAYNDGQDFTYILRAFGALFKQANSEGIAMVAASGDGAGRDCPDPSYFSGNSSPHFIPSVSEPASDPNMVAVGGTNLETTPPASPPRKPGFRSQYVSESAYADPEIAYDPYGLGPQVSGGSWGSGSGASALWAKPWYQYLVNVPSAHRSIPDVSMQMGGCPANLAITPCQPGDSYSNYVIAGQQYGFIGTSLSAPEFAGLLALKMQAQKSRIGCPLGYIYELAAAQDAVPSSLAAPAYHQGIPGANGVVTVAAGQSGYNPILGVGTPLGANFIGLPNLSLAGNPRTLSNP